MDHRIKAGGNLDEWNALPAEATQQLEALHRPKAINPKFRGERRSEVGQLYDEKRLGAEEMQDWAGDWQLLPSQQGLSFSWKSFLPQRQLKILLVETDDSTRQILSALLRNCNYEVLSVANGLQAWDLLGGPTNPVDMVLTEVAMPCLSGIALLRRITAHTPCKNVPVIMMSANDSMRLVVKCLSNGAVDFLLKPVRKNELSNLWQHVWRRYHSSLANGNWSGSPHLRASGLKMRAGSGNNRGSNAENNNGSSEMNVMDGSGTQGSRTKLVRERSPGKRRETICINMSHTDSSTKNMSAMLADEVSDINQATSTFIPALALPRCEMEIHGGVGSIYAMGKPGSPVSKGKSEDEEDPAGTEALSDTEEHKKSIDFFDIFSCQERCGKGEDCDNSDMGIQTGKTLLNAFIEKTASDSTFLPTLELSLKRPRAAGEIESQENRVLKRSVSSAFSRYNNCTSSSRPLHNKSSPRCRAAVFSDKQGLVPEHSMSSTRMDTMPTVHAERVGNLKTTGDVVKPLSMYNVFSHCRKNQDLGLLSTVSTNQDDLASPMSNIATSSVVGPVPLSLRMSTTMYDEPSFPHSSVQPFFYAHPVAPQKPVPRPLVDRDGACKTGGLHDPMQSCGIPPRVDCHCPHYTHRHQIQIQQHQNVPQKSPVASQSGEQTVTNVRCGTSQCGLSHTVNVVEGKDNCKIIVHSSECDRSGSVNEVGTASNNVSNGVHEKNNGESGMQPPHGVYVDNGIEYVRKRVGTGDIDLLKKNGSSITTESEQNPSVRREAALSKFRQKRKERCFQKKVRYVSRKVLAEQRPRVRGQFVRQPVCAPVSNKPEMFVGTVF